MANVQDVDEKNFEAEVLNAGTPVLVDFWAPWCGPCRMLAPTVEAVAQELAGKLKVVKLNVDDSGALAVKYGVQGIPVLMLFKDGKVADQLVGNQPKPRILERLQSHL
jgi:thioredoxin 1